MFLDYEIVIHKIIKMATQTPVQMHKGFVKQVSTNWANA